MQRPADLEDEDRIAVADHVGTGIVAEIATDIGRDVADECVADALRHDGRFAVLAPAMQHMGNPLVGEERVVRAVGAVHGDDVRQLTDLVGAAIVGGDA